MAKIIGVDDHQTNYERQNREDRRTDNRANETLNDSRTSNFISITLEKIDKIILNHLRNMELSIEDDNKQVQVPVDYANAERWKQIRKDGYLRDGAGKLQTPVILFRRTGISKSPYTSPINQYLDRTYQTSWNKYNAYDKFAVLNRIIPPKETMSVLIPDYVHITYEFMAWTDYVIQMNSILEQLTYEVDQYWGERGDFKFYVKVDDYTTDTDIPAEGDRIVKTSFNLLAKAYLLPETTYDVDRGHIATTQKRYTSKKMVTIIEVDLGVGGHGGTSGDTEKENAGEFNASGSFTTTPIIIT